MIGSDVPSDFLLEGSAGTIKSLCGNDLVDAELKGEKNKIHMKGRFNIIITANDKLKINIDGDTDAWRRRLILLEFKKPAVKHKIPDFSSILYREEGPGILNWMIEGAVKVLLDGYPDENASNDRVDNLLRESHSVTEFLSECIMECPGAEITTDSLIPAYEMWCSYQNWTPLPQSQSKKQLHDEIQRLFHKSEVHDIRNPQTGKSSARGYHGLALNTDQVNQPKDSMDALHHFRTPKADRKRRSNQSAGQSGQEF